MAIIVHIDKPLIPFQRYPSIHLRYNTSSRFRSKKRNYTTFKTLESCVLWMGCTGCCRKICVSVISKRRWRKDISGMFSFKTHNNSEHCHWLVQIYTLCLWPHCCRSMTLYCVTVAAVKAWRESQDKLMYKCRKVSWLRLHHLDKPPNSSSNLHGPVWVCN